MKLAASCCPCKEIAANCRPAIQPSVRVASRAMSSAERLRPIPWLRKTAASEGVKRKSVARSSVNWPGINHVVVVKDEGEISSVTPMASHVVGEQCEHGLCCSRVWHLQQGQCLSPEMWVKRL